MNMKQITERREYLRRQVRDLQYNYDVVEGLHGPEDREEAAELSAQLQAARRALVRFEDAHGLAAGACRHWDGKACRIKGTGKNCIYPADGRNCRTAAKGAAAPVRYYIITTPDGATMDQDDQLTSNSQVLEFMQGPGMTPAEALAAFKLKESGEGKTPAAAEASSYGAFESFEVYELAAGVNPAVRG